MKTISPTTDVTPSAKLNEPAVRNMVDGIIADPDSWSMNHWATQWSCGTTYCAAGLTVIQAGYEMIWSKKLTFDVKDAALLCKKPGDVSSYSIPHKAQELLGFSDLQSEYIFYFYNVGEGKHPTVEQFVQRVADVTGLEFKIPE